MEQKAPLVKLSSRGVNLQWLAYILAVAAFVLAFPKLYNVVDVFLAREMIYSDDIFSQLVYLGRCSAVGAFENDYLAKYTFEALLPFGYRSFFCAAAYSVDPLVLARLVSVALLFLYLLMLGLLTLRLSTPWCAALSVALALAADVQILQIDGGLPHSFSIPLLALHLYASVLQKFSLLVLLVPLSAATYPILTPFFGIYLFLHLAWGSYRRHESFLPSAIVLLATATVSFLLVLPTLSASEFGRRILPNELAAFPEAGAGGRYDSFSRPPFPSLFEEIALTLKYTFFSGVKPLYAFVPESLSLTFHPFLLLLVALCSVAGLWVLCRGRHGASVLFLIISVISTYVAAHMAYPYLYFPGRVIEHFISAFSLVLVPLGIDFFLRGLQRLGEQGRALLLVVLCIVVTLSDRVFLPVKLDRPEDVPLYEFLSAQEGEVLVAGWADGLVNRISYMSSVPIYLSYESHQVLHTLHTQTLRKRAFTLIDGLFYANEKAVTTLRNQGVTHLLVESKYYSSTVEERKDVDQYSATERRKYFAPFNEYIRLAPLQAQILTVLSSENLVVNTPHYQLYRLSP